MEKNQMNNERRELLNLRNLPARLEVEEAGWYLGFAAHAIPILIRAGLLNENLVPTGVLFSSHLRFQLR
jgi:hypothetical protein